MTDLGKSERFAHGKMRPAPLHVDAPTPNLGHASPAFSAEGWKLSSPRVPARVGFVVAGVIFSIVFIANCWIGDDAFISFRVSDNLIHGYGPRWNVAERVQVFTNPLWTFLMAGVAAITGEFYYTAMAVSFVVCLLMLAVVWRWLDHPLNGWLALALLVSSKSFVDYSSSGLEYPLTYLLLSIFVAVLVGRQPASEPSPRVPLLIFIASLAFVNRADMVLLYVPALAWLVASDLRRHGWRAARPMLLAAAPAWGWLLFATVYYGFPFPNTYYAKAQSGMPHWLQLRQGFAYTVSSLRFDPITLATIATAVGVSMVAGTRRTRLLALGAGSYVFYTIWVGGDFMAGRFFAAPFLLSTLLLASLPKQSMTALACVMLIALYNVIFPLAPFKSIPDLEAGWNWRLQNGVKDDRGSTIAGASPLAFEVFRRMPDNAMAREARSLRASPDPVLVHPWIGEVGFIAGPTKYIIDPNALSDPLLARLPIPPSFYFEFWVSHFTRELPAGYIESRREQRNLIQDPVIHEHFDKLLRVTTGPVFSIARFKDILALNWHQRSFKAQVKARQRLNATVRVTNPLFWTHAGWLDEESRLIRSNGQPGYLLMGPGTPLSRGVYKVQWGGSVAQRSGAGLGFVEICHDDCRVQLARAEIEPFESTIARIAVTVPHDVRDVEFRMYVNAGNGIDLSYVTITQQ
jgi:arabinofuranosyltransferase